MSVVTRTVILTGAHAGKTIQLGRYSFQDGRTKLIGPPSEVDSACVYIERNWEGYPEGHPLLESDDGKRNLQEATERNKQHALSSGVQPNGAGTGEASTILGSESGQGTAGTSAELAARDGSAPDVNLKLLAAVRGLDVDNDEHWTQDGKPAIAAIQNIYGQTGFARKDVDAVLPGFSRAIAKEAKAAEESGE